MYMYVCMRVYTPPVVSVYSGRGADAGLALRVGAVQAWRTGRMARGRRADGKRVQGGWQEGAGCRVQAV